MKKFVNFLLIFSDFLFLLFLFYFSKYIFIKFDLNFNIRIINFLFVIFIILINLIYEKIYIIRYDFWQETKKIFKALFFSYLIILFIIISFHSINFINKIKFLNLYFLLNFLLFPIYKRLLKKILFKFNLFKEKIKIIGENDLLKKEIRKNWYLGMKEDDNFENVLIISKDFNIKELNRFLDIFSNKKIYLIPFLNEINYINSEILEYFNIRINAIKIENHLLEKKNILIKNIFDIFFALLITPIFLFLHLFIFCLIKLDSKGSVFFKQKRIGKDGKIFVCYKYRTMYENGEEILKEYLKRHPEEKDYYEKYHKYKNDPRITKIGKFLRSTSLDELPQIINILKGEMSFVGPRPYLPKEIIKLKDYKDFIFKVKPGLTGLWQVSGRNNLTFKERMELDKWYIKNWSLWMDFIILIKTFKVVILRIGAK